MEREYTYMNSVLLNLFRLALWPRIWPIFIHAYVYLERRYIPLLGEVSYGCQLYQVE